MLQLEAGLLPLLAHNLDPDQVEYLEETMEIISALAQNVPVISEGLWQLFPLAQQVRLGCAERSAGTSTTLESPSMMHTFAPGSALSRSELSLAMLGPTTYAAWPRIWSKRSAGSRNPAASSPGALDCKRALLPAAAGNTR